MKFSKQSKIIIYITLVVCILIILIGIVIYRGPGVLGYIKLRLAYYDCVDVLGPDKCDPCNYYKRCDEVNYKYNHGVDGANYNNNSSYYRTKGYGY